MILGCWEGAVEENLFLKVCITPTCIKEQWRRTIVGVNEIRREIKRKRKGKEFITGSEKIPKIHFSNFKHSQMLYDNI